MESNFFKGQECRSYPVELRKSSCSFGTALQTAPDLTAYIKLWFVYPGDGLSLEKLWDRPDDPDDCGSPSQQPVGAPQLEPRQSVLRRSAPTDR